MSFGRVRRYRPIPAVVGLTQGDEIADMSQTPHGALETYVYP